MKGSGAPPSEPIPAREHPQSTHEQGPRATGDPGMAMFWSLVGALPGALIGYLFRPSIPLVGQQLPFTVVITRGATLSELDRLLLTGIAQQSFNYMLVGALVGAAIGAFIGYKQRIGDGNTTTRAKDDGTAVSVASAATQSTLASTVVNSAPITVRLGQTREDVMSVLGAPQKVMDVGSKTIYIYSDLKITFTDGKVVDVQ